MTVRKIKKQTYVTHLLDDGTQTREEIPSRSIRKITPREDAFGFIVFEQIVVEVQDKDAVRECLSDPTYESGTFFTKGELLEKIDVAQKFPDREDITTRMSMIEEMTDKTIKVVVYGDNFYLFRERDKMYERRD